MGNTRPTHAVYCPQTEDHQGRCNRLLAAINKNSFFFHCREHDWVEIEFYRFGKKVTFKDLDNIAIEISQVKLEPGEKALHFKLKSMPVHAKGQFKVRSKSFRKGIK